MVPESGPTGLLRLLALRTMVDTVRQYSALARALREA
jgi:hypothetical protein